MPARELPANTGPGGFTLVELLVVLLVMGLLAGMVTTSAQPDERTHLRVEAERLAQLLTLAATEARRSGTAIAWTADGPGYRFWRASDGGDWLRLADGPILRPRTLPPGMTVANLRVENARAAERMRVEFSPNGAPPPFTVDLSLGAAHSTLASSILGEVRIAAGGANGHD